MENLKKGFIPVMLTPFSENGTVDFKALDKLTAYYLKTGASGLFANCLSSEMYELDEAERLLIIAHVLDVVDGAVPVVATGTFGGSMAKQADFVKKVHDLGTDAVIAITSMLAAEEETDLVFDERVMELTGLTEGIPLGFYECPLPYKRTLSPEQLKRFVSTGRVIYHKDTCLNLGEVAAKVQLTSKYKFGLYDAYMGHAVESLRAGAAGLSCIQGNFFPELLVWLCDHYNNDNLKLEVDRVQLFLSANMDIMHHVYPMVSKYFLKNRGLNISTFTRRKVGHLTSSIENQLKNLSDDYSLLQSDLEINTFI